MKKNSILPLFLVVMFGFGCNLLSKKEEQIQPKTAETPAVITESSPNRTEEMPKITEKNLLSLASGAYLLKHPPSFGFWSVKLIDGTDDFWISPGGRGTNQIFIIGLPTETTFKSFSFVKGNDYYGEGSSAKDVLVEVSNTDWKTGYQKVLETSLPLEVDANQKFSVTTEIPARFVRLTVKNAHKNPENVSLADFRGYGEQKQVNPPASLTGTYQTISQKGDYSQPQTEDEGEYTVLTEAEAKNITPGYDSIYLKQNGTMVFGCYTSENEDQFNGGLEGNVAQTNWEKVKGETPYKGVMSFSADGKFLYYTEFNEEMGFADYKVYQKVNSNVGKCNGIKGFSDKDAGKSQLAEDLEKDGRAVIYGINFDYNSDILREESKATLNQIVAVLKEKPDWKMTIEGHTDNIGGDSFNQTLSEKRANAVKKYLVEAGIEDVRLTASGKGLSSPVAPNETEFGRAKNRRVELVKQ